MSAYLVLATWAVVSVGPMAWMFWTSVKTNREIAANIWAPALVPHFRYWASALLTAGPGTVPLYVNIVNTVLVAVPATIIILVIGGTAGYSIAHYGTRTGKVVQACVLAVFPIPVYVILVPVWAYIRLLGLSGTLMGLGLVYVGFNLGFALLLMRGFFAGFPKELIEAAKLDGCGELGALMRIVLRLSAGPLAVVGLLVFLGLWGDFAFSFILIHHPAHMTVQPALAIFSPSSSVHPGLPNYSAEFSAMALVSILPALMYVVLQRQIFEALTGSLSLGR